MQPDVQVSRTTIRAQSGEVRLEPLPDPAREVLAGGVLEPGDLVEVVVVEPRVAAA